MGMSMGLSVILFLLLSGGGFDLLDFLGTAEYWKEKNVAVSYEAMAKELTSLKAEDAAPLIAKLGDEDFSVRDEATKRLAAMGASVVPQLKKAAESSDLETATRAKKLLQTLAVQSRAGQIRRLMAVRTLGELKDNRALPLLQPLLQAQELFMAEYAARAVAAIEGKPYVRPVPTTAERKSDALLLPPGCGVVAGIAALPGASSPTEIFEKLAALEGPADAKDEMLKQIRQKVLEVAERIGNARIDALTIGVAENVGEDSGFVVAVFRGRFDPETVSQLLVEECEMQRKENEGRELLVFESNIENVVYVAPVSAERLIFVTGPNQRDIPLTTIIKKLKNPPATDLEIEKLLAGTDLAQPLWLSARMNDNYRQVPFFAPFDRITLGGTIQNDSLDLKLAAVGKDAKAVADGVEQVKQMLAEGVKELRGELKRMPPPMRPMAKNFVEFLSGITLHAVGKQAVGQASFKNISSLGMMMPMMFMMEPSDAMAAPVMDDEN